MIDYLKHYKNKTIFITGHTGFKGSWLSLWLLELGAKVVGYSIDIPTNPSLFKALQLKKDILHITGDVRDYKHLEKSITKHKPSHVFHLAAQPLVRFSYDDPLTTLSTNIMGTANILNIVRTQKSIRSVINVTSDKCYENKEWQRGYHENDPMGGHDPYSASKACAELVNSAYLKSFFINKKPFTGLASVRAGNVIGGGDWGQDRLVPDFVRSVVQNKKLIIRNPKATRPWQHILDLLSGYLNLGARLYDHGPEYSGPWNFGPLHHEVYSVEDIIKKCISIWQKGSYKAQPDKQKKHEAHSLILNCAKSSSRLQWQPQYKIQESLEKTILWYKEFYNGDVAKIKKYSLLQISEYQEQLKSTFMTTIIQ